MDPPRRPLPRRRECCIPDLRDGGYVNLARQSGAGLACLCIVDREGPAPMKVERAGYLAIAGRNPAEAHREPGQVCGEATEIMDAVGVRRFACEPAVERPWPGIAGA